MPRAKTRKKPKALTPYIKTMHELFERADKGDEGARKVCVGCLRNLGCDHLADHGYRKDEKTGRYTVPKWLRFYRGLMLYLGSLVGEYGMTEAQAFKDLLAEVNAARYYSHDVSLESD